MIFNSITQERFNQWSDVAISPKEDVVAPQAALKFYATASFADKVQRIFNGMTFLLAGAKILSLISPLNSAASALATKGFAAIGATGFLQNPSVAAITALAPRIIGTLALILVVRKVLAVLVYHIIYPAVLDSRSYIEALDRQRWNTFRTLGNEGFESRRVALNLSGIDYDAFTFEHKDTKGNAQWVIIAGGNGWIGESACLSCAEEFKDLGFNVLFVNGPGVGRSTGYPTNYSIKAAHEAGLQFLEDAVQAKKILLYGTSLGGGAHSEAIKSHHFKTKNIDYLVWSDRSFDTLSNAASALVTSLAKVAFFLLGIELNGIVGARKLEEHAITHIVTQHSMIIGQHGVLPLDEVFVDDASDGVIHNKISLYVGLKNAGFRDSARLKCYGGPGVNHNGSMSSTIMDLVKQDIDAFLNPQQTTEAIESPQEA